MKTFILVAMLFALTLQHALRPVHQQAVATNVELANAHKCNGPQWCDQPSGRICSFLGWCQDSTYSGPKSSRFIARWRDLKSIETVNGHRCAGVCDPTRICSAWGWCQDSTYTGPRW